MSKEPRTHRFRLLLKSARQACPVRAAELLLAGWGAHRQRARDLGLGQWRRAAACPEAARVHTLRGARTVTCAVARACLPPSPRHMVSALLTCACGTLDMCMRSCDSLVSAPSQYAPPRYCYCYSLPASNPPAAPCRRGAPPGRPMCGPRGGNATLYHSCGGQHQGLPGGAPGAMDPPARPHHQHLPHHHHQERQHAHTEGRRGE